MKKFKNLIIAIVTILMVLCMFNLRVYATNVEENGVQASDAEALPEEGEEDHEHTDIEAHEGDLYMVSTDDEYVMSENVDGNVFIVGKNVKITGMINGSLFVFASGDLQIAEEAYVVVHTFAFANNIDIQGMTYDAYVAALGDINIGENTIISRDIRAASENMYLYGIIGRDAYLAANEISVPEEQGKLTIYGNLDYTSSSEIIGLENAEIQGQTTYTEMNKPEEKKSNTVMDYIFSAISTIIFNVVLYMLLIYTAPKFIEKSKEYVSVRGLLGLAIGIGFTILVPIIALLLMITGIGAGLSVLVLLVYAVVLMCQAFVVATAINEFLANKINFNDNKFKKLLLLVPVSAILWAVRKLPYIGVVASIATFLCGVGIIVLYQFDIRKKDKANENV